MRPGGLSLWLSCGGSGGFLAGPAALDGGRGDAQGGQHQGANVCGTGHAPRGGFGVQKGRLFRGEVEGNAGAGGGRRLFFRG